MATSISDPVTIDRAYFETLLRRANYNNDSQRAIPFTHNDEMIIPVPKEDYEKLVLLSRQFENLKRSLLGAGVTEESIATLVQDATGVPPTDTYADSTHFYDHNESDGIGTRPRHAEMPTSTFRAASYTTYGPTANGISGMRGGQLLDVYLRGAEHTASVSFVREDDATRFYEYARKSDIYIKNKRVFIKWADRHFILPGHIAGKIAAGATRNLIIRRCGAHHTEDSVRDDLEHIHNLIVVKVEFVGGSCYIKTNSVHNAMFARTCMMSRAKYKGSKIEWDIDECDQPIEAVQKVSLKPIPQRLPAKPAVAGTRNRFDMLRLDDDDNNDSDDKFDTSSEMPSTVDVAA
ncbi:hypothetical protein ONZ43_g3203 [Nemania bipapillata]|uniref:Uncharacterized protein n=1 Tax=Nemania bipapillata TaxID=110536 RepID=A0ACC2IXQ4_9PEZI|nr:hypothetical protein ONZ43_g3203 [Nemania bipapillata]